MSDYLRLSRNWRRFGCVMLPYYSDVAGAPQNGPDIVQFAVISITAPLLWTAGRWAVALDSAGDAAHFRVKDRSGKVESLGCELQAWTE